MSFERSYYKSPELVKFNENKTHAVRSIKIDIRLSAISLLSTVAFPEIGGCLAGVALVSGCYGIVRWGRLVDTIRDFYETHPELDRLRRRMPSRH